MNKIAYIGLCYYLDLGSLYVVIEGKRKFHGSIRMKTEQCGVVLHPSYGLLPTQVFRNFKKLQSLHQRHTYHRPITLAISIENL